METSQDRGQDQGNGLLLDQTGGLVHVCLNRPAVLNALSHDMITGLRDVLEEAGERPLLLSGAGGRAFCAGGDIKAVWNAVKAGNRALAARYFHDEYAMNAAIEARGGTYVSFLNGITMGGGYGVSAHGSHLVATELTQFAMPEVKIGFFPDVGAVYRLVRLPVHAGTYLALTGNTIGPADMIYAGLAHAHIETARFDRLKRGLAEGANVDDLLHSLHTPAQGESVLERHASIIAQAFAKESVVEILDALDSTGDAFAVQTAAEIRLRSPISTAVALAHMRAAEKDDFATVIARDLHIALRFLETEDFAEGVRAAVIDKDRNPRWNPASHTDIDAERVRLYLGAKAD